MVQTINAAAEYWRAQGVYIPPFMVQGGPQSNAIADARAPWGPRPARIRVSYDLRGYFAADRALIALHETVHLAQRVEHDDTRSTPWVEGQAESLAEDHVCPFMVRAYGVVRAMHTCRHHYRPYHRETAAVRTYSARVTGAPWRTYPARRWRLDNLAAVSWQRYATDKEVSQ